MFKHGDQCRDPLSRITAAQKPIQVGSKLLGGVEL